MVNPLIHGYLEWQDGRERLDRAERQMLGAYRQYQQTLQEYGPAPEHGWWRVKVTAHEDAVTEALDQYHKLVLDLAVSSPCFRPRF